MSLDLSQNEVISRFALALEGNGLPQGLCKSAALVALSIALEGRDPTDIALGWRAEEATALACGLSHSAKPNRRVTCISADNWERLWQLSTKTLVPESDASKLSGAGAGTQDND